MGQQHDFRKHTFEENVRCGVCTKWVWGEEKEGLVCEACGTSTHEACRYFAGACTGRRPSRESMAGAEEEEDQSVDVTITICSAQGLVRTSVLHQPDPFCILNVDGDETRSPVCKKTTNPVWNNKIVVSLQPNTPLALYIYDKRKYKEFHQGSAFLGMAHIPTSVFNSVNLDTGSNMTFRLKKLKDTDAVAGYVTIHAVYTKAEKPLVDLTSSSSGSGKFGMGGNAGGVAPVSTMGKIEKGMKEPKGKMRLSAPGGAGSEVDDSKGKGKKTMRDQSPRTSVGAHDASPISLMDQLMLENNDVVEEEFQLRSIASDEEKSAYEGWEKKTDDNGKTYYVNLESEEVMFSPPTRLAQSMMKKNALALQRQKSEERYQNTYDFYRIRPEKYTNTDQIDEAMVESDGDASSSVAVSRSNSTNLNEPQRQSNHSPRVTVNFDEAEGMRNPDSPINMDDSYFLKPDPPSRIRRSFDILPEGFEEKVSANTKRKSKSSKSSNSLLPLPPKHMKCSLNVKEPSSISIKWKPQEEKSSSLGNLLFSKGDKKTKFKYTLYIAELGDKDGIKKDANSVEEYSVLYVGEEPNHVAVGLEPGLVYGFKVSAANEYGSSPLSAAVSVLLPVPPRTGPSKPSSSTKPKNPPVKKRDCPYFMAGYCPYGANCRFEHGSGFQTEDDLLAFQVAAALNQSPQAAIVAATQASLRESEEAKIDTTNMPQYKRNFHKKQKDLRSELPIASGECHITVKRDNLFLSSYEALSALSTEQLCKHLFVHFEGEGGLDYGGLAREWFFLLSRELCSSRLGLFEYSGDSTYTLQINPDTAASSDHLKYYHFVGRLFGLAVFHRHFMDMSFFIPFYKQMLNNYQLTLSDLQTVDPSIHRSLIWMLENDVSCLESTFSVDCDKFGEVETIDLKPNGRNILVTEKNKREFVQLMVESRCQRGTETQMDLFKSGFNEFIPSEKLVGFDERELEFLICGLTKLDVEDWQKNTIYKGFGESDAIVVWFWRILKEMDMEGQSRLLQFVTGTCRVPIEGFQALQGTDGPRKFCIQKLYDSTHKLPESHTCFNRLDLPEYDSKEQLAEKLLIAIEGFEGFTGD
eukprot:Nk52_evm106s485 gene=Nk52_evmTU106s485